MTSTLKRRTLLGLGLLLLSACSTFKGWPGSPQAGFIRLKRPVVIPLRKLAEAWQSVSFEAWISPDTDAGADKLIKGLLIRTNEPDDAGLKAYSILCPHEICEVLYLRDTSLIPKEADTPALPNHPLLSCPCHFSIFNPIENGARINGPAPRGLYRFRVEIRGASIRITEIEEGVLSLFS